MNYIRFKLKLDFTKKTYQKRGDYMIDDKWSDRFIYSVEFESNKTNNKFSRLFIFDCEYDDKQIEEIIFNELDDIKSVLHIDIYGEGLELK